ncbi:OmpA family protein [Roseinatronobacter monicus]|uniref:OOP family OmpA-OmpF porin n=1 Tax=Roseinatronobacter monicus TaxID=393481 RepID=A0A543KGN2_9RHOB|nr:OmpA family protein [Roseinatronobacter monicus]TQM94241.1 OOP family OmpA-OmpF porin [Roseinatronobacter monicus]
MKERLINVAHNLRGLRVAKIGSYKAYVLMGGIFALAIVLAIGAATFAVRGIEHVVARDAHAVLAESEIDWAEVQTDGLLLTLRGEAESEAARFRALSAVSTVVAAERVIDDIQVAPSMEIAAPRFLLEILRNGLDVSVIGLVPTSLDTDGIIARIEAIDPEISVVNMLETASHPVPFGWDRAVGFGLEALASIPASKISISADQVEVTGLADSARQRDEMRDKLMRQRPRGLIASINISAPRPVLTPFTLRFVIEESGARFDACSADTSEARTAILRSGRAAGAQGIIDCTIGLGSPSPRWQVAATESIDALGVLGTGSVTIADTDVSLVVPNSVSAEQFDRAAAELERQLPDVFSLDAQRLPPPDGEGLDRDGDAIEFVASRDSEGIVLLRGHLTDERLRDAVYSMARTEFGLNAVRINARLDPDLPGGWPVRAMLAIDTLAQLEHGQVRVRADRFDISGVSGDASASDTISRAVAEQLGRGAVFNLNIRYDERFDPVAMRPTPARCEAWITEVLEEQQITFDPGSASIVSGAGRVIDKIAEILRDCGRLEMEVAGHTDSQGRLETNMRLSQQRAEAVVAALSARGILVSEFVAEGYGPEFPVADNSTASGREANRRIEFRLLGESAAEATQERTGDAPDTERDAAETPDEADLEIVVTTGAGEQPRPPERPER